MRRLVKGGIFVLTAGRGHLCDGVHRAGGEMAREDINRSTVRELIAQGESLTVEFKG
jgi:hypothetical protein